MKARMSEAAKVLLSNKETAGKLVEAIRSDDFKNGEKAVKFSDTLTITIERTHIMSNPEERFHNLLQKA